MRKLKLILSGLCLCALVATAQKKDNVVDQVIWVVGDSPILLSDVEEAKLAIIANGGAVDNPYCVIPENLAVQKLFLHQADIDSIYADEGMVSKRVNAWLDDAVQYYGSRENVEAWARRSFNQLREDRKRALRDESRVEQVKQKLVQNVKVTPSEVREYFKHLPNDSLPFISTQVEVQLITSQPRVKRAEIERVESVLRDYAKRVNDGQTEFSTLARFYSEDPGSARNGGEIGYKGRAELAPEYANVAFTLNDPKKVSKIVKTEFGYHIIQLIDKRGDKVNTRHILIKPQIPDSQYVAGELTLDSIAADIRSGKLTFGQAASAYSDDKNTRNNKGLMSNYNRETGLSSARFQMQDLNSEIAKVVDTMKVGEISKSFVFTNDKGQKVCAIVKLKSRIEGHRANMTEDFQALRSIVYERKCQDKIDRWINDKVKSTYVRIMPDWRSCHFKYHWNL